jgi:cytochrome c oxidase subunit II
MKRFLVPIVLTVVIAVPLVLLFESVDLTPVLASEQGRNVDQLLRILFIIAAVIFAGVMAFLLYSVVAFRRRPGDLTDAKPVYGNTGLEIAWTLVPLIIVLVVAGIGTAAVLAIHQPADDQDLEVIVTGFQWAWSFEYPQYQIVTGELVLPVNRTALFKLRSRDVIHSFFVPEFRIKMDAIPGELNELRLTPTHIGEYRTYCAELCGTSHAYMVARVRVVAEPVFAEWVSNQQLPIPPAADPVATGATLYFEQGCRGCHSTDGSRLVGPTFQGLFGTQRPLTDGTTVIADEGYLRTAILDPGAQVVQGFDNIMPGSYADLLREAQVDALIAYIESLRP